MKKGYLISLILLAVLLVVSLVLNAVAIAGVLWLRQVALTAVAAARATLPGISDGTFSYNLEINQDIPIAASVPINEEVTVPIQTTIPISTVVTVPVNAGFLGSFDIDVPVYTVIPVDLEVVIPVSKTLDISTTVQLNVDVPIEIPLAETPLTGYIEGLDAGLARLEGELERPMGVRIGKP